MATLLLALYASLVALNALDGVSTWKVLRPTHFNRERNPLARKLFQKLGILRGIIVAELLWIGFITLVFFLFWKNPALIAVLLALLCLGVAVFAVIVLGNFRAAGRIRKRDELAAAKEAIGSKYAKPVA